MTCRKQNSIAHTPAHVQGDIRRNKEKKKKFTEFAQHFNLFNFDHSKAFLLSNYYAKQMYFVCEMLSDDR